MLNILVKSEFFCRTPDIQRGRRKFKDVLSSVTFDQSKAAMALNYYSVRRSLRIGQDEAEYLYDQTSVRPLWPPSRARKFTTEPGILTTSTINRSLESIRFVQRRHQTDFIRRAVSDAVQWERGSRVHHCKPGT